LVAMAPHVSRFIRRLFDVDARAEAVSVTTRAQDDLFRFKVDFVRRRSLPLVKGGAHVDVSPEDDAIVEKLIAAQGIADRELAVARAGCALMDVEKSAAAQPAAPSPEAQALKRWCAARLGSLHRREYREWVIFRFPETLDYFNLVEVKRPMAELPEAMFGPDWRLRRRDGFKLTDA